MKAKIDFTFKNKFYEKNKELDPKDFGFEKIVEMNEKGFIYPLTAKELFKIEEDLQNPVKVKKEDKYGNFN